jgi:hypothetical protein
MGQYGPGGIPGYDLCINNRMAELWLHGWHPRWVILGCDTSDSSVSIHQGTSYSVTESRKPGIAGRTNSMTRLILVIDAAKFDGTSSHPRVSPC